MTKSWATKWKTVQIPEEYYNQVEEFVKKSNEYVSVSEYVRSALRKQLKEDHGREEK